MAERMSMNIQTTSNIMSQQLVTNYYKSGKGPASGDMNTPGKKHRLSLNRSQTSLTPPKRRQITETDDKTNIVNLLSSDDENSPSLTPPNNLSPTSVESDSSDKTIIYSPPVTPSKSLPTPSPKFQSPASTSKQPSPSKRGRFYSPSKKCSVLLKSPRNSFQKHNVANSSRKLFEDDAEEKSIVNACHGVDDKTKFLIKDINNLLKEPALRQLLDEDAIHLLADYFLIPKLGMKLICRLHWRKEGWYRVEEIRKICSPDKNDLVDEATTQDVLKALIENKFLVSGSNSNMTFKQYTSILKADDLKEICKDLKLKTQSKKNAVEVLQDYCRTTSISCYFSNKNGNCTANNNRHRVLQIMAKKVGPCYTLSDLARSTLERLYILTYLGIDYEVIRENRLELTLINEKIQRETFPVSPDMNLDNASMVFEDREEFERYVFAHQYYEAFLSETKPEERCQMVRQVYNLYRDLREEDLIRYKSLQPWLQRYTPACVYLKILEAGLLDLKKGKIITNCLLALDVLTILLDQTFREHKKAEWYAEKALVLHTYLNRPDEAAQVLIEGFESDLSHTSKDCMRPRARKISQQKNIVLDECVRHTLLAYATNDDLLERSIPSWHIHKQPMENSTKGKAMYETKNSQGRVMQGVEDYARSCYIESGKFTHGEHWEGRIVTTIFFLLFWDVIYSSPGVRGVFLCRLQRLPLDMWSEEFYTNRKEAVEGRLSFVETCSVEQMLECMCEEWERRPEHELSGISRQIGWAPVSAVARCLGPRRVAALCRRLAADYRYSHSGFPDLTLWHEGTGAVGIFFFFSRRHYLGPRRVAALCRRLAADYRYSHSGFPDLTLWHEGTGTVSIFFFFSRRNYLGPRRVAALCRRLAADYRYSHSGFPDLTLWHEGTGALGIFFFFSRRHYLGPRRVAALCRRLAADYRYSHSGFPDLTLWHEGTGTVSIFFFFSRRHYLGPRRVAALCRRLAADYRYSHSGFPDLSLWHGGTGAVSIFFFFSRRHYLGPRRVAALCRRLAADYRYSHSGFPDLTLWHEGTGAVSIFFSRRHYLGPRRVAALCRRLAADYRYSHSGFPDLTLWHEGTGAILFAEVKSDSDKPSTKQLQWLQYLRASGIDAEFCYVGARTERHRARNNKKAETAGDT